MGKRGPSPKPTAILKLHGSWRAKTRTNEPQPKSGKLVKPNWLRADASQFWDEVIEDLHGMGLATRADSRTLARYCNALARYVELDRFLVEHGETETVVTENGSYTKEYPQAARIQSVSETLLKIEIQFGLTPSARARFAQPATADKMRGKEAQYFKGG